MYKEKRIGVIVQAYNEQLLIERTVRSIPKFVDAIIVIDDCSLDQTQSILNKLESEIPRLHVTRHSYNQGAGAAAHTGYQWCKDNGVDIAVVMAGDGQMDPEDLPALLDPLVNGFTDYTKGNRLVSGEAWTKIPRIRYLGNSMLTLLTKIASGYWHVTDSQTGYAALNRDGIELLASAGIFPRYGYPNDVLTTLNIHNFRVTDIPVKPVYGIGEQSGIRLRKVLFSLSLLMFRLFLKRMTHKYVIRDFHPLVFFYLLGFAAFLCNIPLCVRLFIHKIEMGVYPPMNSLAIVFCFFVGLQSILFAMLFDMEANRDLKGDWRARRLPR